MKKNEPIKIITTPGMDVNHNLDNYHEELLTKLKGYSKKGYNKISDHFSKRSNTVEKFTNSQYTADSIFLKNTINFERGRPRLPILKQTPKGGRKRRPMSSVMKREKKSKNEEIEKMRFIKDYLRDSHDLGMGITQKNGRRVLNNRYGKTEEDINFGYLGGYRAVNKRLKHKKIRPLTGMSRITGLKIPKMKKEEIMKLKKIDNCKGKILQSKIIKKNEVAKQPVFNMVFCGESEDVKIVEFCKVKSMKLKPKKKVRMKELHTLPSSNQFERQIYAKHNKEKVEATKKISKNLKKSNPKKLPNLKKIQLKPSSIVSKPIKSSPRPMKNDLYRLSHPFLNIENLLKNFFEKSKYKDKSKKFICFFSSQDFFILRNLKNKGFLFTQRVPRAGLELFSLKWISQDKDTDYANLLADQYMNHFQNNKEMTSKSFLSKNMRNWLDGHKMTETFIPRSYNFSSPDQVKYFKKDFFTGSLFLLLKNHIEYFKQIYGKEKFEKRIKSVYRQKILKEENELMKEILRPEKLYIHSYQIEFKRGCVNYGELERNPEFITQMTLIEETLHFYKSLYRQLTCTESKENYFTIQNFGRKSLKQIYRFSQYQPPYHKLSEEKKKRVSGADESWKTPNELLVLTLYTIHKTFKESLAGIYTSREDKNLWIVKPASNARGQGIYLTNKLSEIIPNNSSGNKGRDRLVMKYIERPLLYPVKHKNGATLKHKFDLRIWVLVTSLAPLEIYIFSSFYGRLCSQPYRLGAFEDVRIHLSNYSVNKEFFKKKKKVGGTPSTKKDDNNDPGARAMSMSTVGNRRLGMNHSNIGKMNVSSIGRMKKIPKMPKSDTKKKTTKNPIKSTPCYLDKSESVIEASKIKNMVYEQYGVEWDKKIQPEIEKIIVTTIQACAENMKHRERSFEIYGFDILLDYDLNPWLLEVNLSPACAERTKFLKEMLKSSAIGLFEILKKREEKEIKVFNNDVNRFRKEKENYDQIKKVKDLRDSFKGDFNAGYEGTLSDRFGDKIAASMVNMSKDMKNGSFLGFSHAFGKTKIPKLRKPPMKLMPVFSTLDFDSVETEKEYFWKLIYEERKRDINEKMISKGQKGYMDIQGNSLKLKTLKKHTEIIKKNYFASLIQGAVKGFLVRIRTKKKYTKIMKLFDMLDIGLSKNIKKEEEEKLEDEEDTKN